MLATLVFRPIMLNDAPRFDATDAARIARDVYGIDVSAQPLTSERDQNFLLTDHAGARRVLKIANATERREILEAQQAAMAHVARHVASCPRPLAATSGELLATVRGTDGREHLVWSVTHLPGVPLGTLRHHSPALLDHFGSAIASLGSALADFDHPAIHRDFHWDLANASRVVREYRPLVHDATLGYAIDVLAERYERHVVPVLDTLPRRAIHADLNDYNVLVDGDRPSGIVDFGDMVHSYAVGDLAIALAYMVLDADDPLATIAHMVRGHARTATLHDDELHALFGLAVMRLCMSACIAAYQLRERPDNLYLDVSQAAIRRTLPALADIPFDVAEAVAREASDLEPSPPGARVRDWLAANRAHFAPVMPFDLQTEPLLVLDLSIASPLVSADSAENAEPLLTRRVNAAMRDAGVRVSIGRYDEPRLLYSSPLFAGDESPLAERRTIHLGMDVFADAGTAVFAPMRGTVHAFADNRAALDYGPVIILRHTVDDGTELFTLYGHLSRESLDGLAIGKVVERGEQIATLGSADVNGGWTPHLHLQLFTTLLDVGKDVPGVVRASQRAAWRSICPDPNLVLGIPGDRFPAEPPSKKETLARRRALFGHNLSIAYRDPLKIVRGRGQYLFDDVGRRYIDAYNNVPHVGHAHPRVVEAAHRQMSLLNTNTRYLSDVVNEYAERLTATFPAPLRVCYLVSSASEANELALRLTRAYTGRRDMIVLEAAYHGNTTGLIDLSPYKHAGPGGTGAPDWVHTVPIPDVYRGAFKVTDPDAGARYARHVAEVVAQRSIGGFIAETCPSVGGQIVLPPGYLAEVYRHVRAAGGVCIADEVQTGLGRMGTSFWAFEDQGVVPDIVVLGKPLGNGYPLAAVVTTPGIAQAFDNGMEFFSTFGGSTVSAAVGLAVLDVMRDEQLQAHALRVGERMRTGLRPLGDKHEIVGDVRGSGLFLGVELVRDRATLEPAGAQASYVSNRMRELGILLGTDGPHHNVVKIRPPMLFNEADADLLVTALDQVLGEVRA
ncbi:MAG TPA: aminotransferase class III-fold pyridoxal phosphate-dependent enzyme [Gemmatimonadaceae bacterium]|nr:aminotransferase class III-fold pyridoxal phosphate-dependent enzyme [Gemmatimonadaceae bacterium]